jgi:hypothetical protein
MDHIVRLRMNEKWQFIFQGVDFQLFVRPTAGIPGG